MTDKLVRLEDVKTAINSQRSLGSNFLYDEGYKHALQDCIRGIESLPPVEPTFTKEESLEDVLESLPSGVTMRDLKKLSYVGDTPLQAALALRSKLSK